MVSALSEIGERERARTLCERLLSLASPLGLYAEELDREKRAPPRQLSPGVHAPRADQRGRARDQRRRLNQNVRRVTRRHGRVIV